MSEKEEVVVDKTNIDEVMSLGPAAVEEYLINVSVAEFKRDVYQLKKAYANKQLAHDVILAMKFAITDDAYEQDFESHLNEEETKELKEVEKVEAKEEVKKEAPKKAPTKKPAAKKKTSTKKPPTKKVAKEETAD